MSKPLHCIRRTKASFKQIFKLFQDFDVFPQQRDLYFGTDKYLNDMLLILTGERWKAMRTLATPIFTSGKLKGMTPIIESVSFKGCTPYLNSGVDFDQRRLFRLGTDWLSTLKGLLQRARNLSARSFSLGTALILWQQLASALTANALQIRMVSSKIR